MRDKIRVVIFAISFICLLLLTLKACRGDFDGKTTPGDTIMVTTHTIDTIWATKVIHDLEKSNPKPSDSSKVIGPIDSSLCNYIRVYRDSTIDSNVVIYHNDSVQGVILERHPKYRLKVPLTITHTINTEKTITIDNSDKFSVYGGLEVGGNKTKFEVGPYIRLNHKKLDIMYRRELIDKTHNIGLGYKIFGKK